MTIPAIDLSKLVLLLKSDGSAELMAAASGKMDGLQVVMEWNNILRVMEREVIPLLSKGCDSKSLLAPARKIANSTGALAALAAQVLSFVPGPIGNVCSLGLAIGCFSVGDIVGGLGELLGCIPGGKVMGKCDSKVFEKVQDIMIEVAQSNDKLNDIVKTTGSAQNKVLKFFEKYGSKAKQEAKPEIGYEYGVRDPMVKNMPSLEEAIFINMNVAKKTNISPKTQISSKNYYYPESINGQYYRLQTNTGKPKI